MLPIIAPHWPLHAKESDIKKYLGEYSTGWDELRKARYARQLELGIIDNSVKLTDRDPEVPAWADIPQEEKETWIRRMAVYAAQIDGMDQGIGRIITALKESNVFENTLIVFLSDNGGCAEAISSNKDNTIGTKESYESYRINWANASNTPFKLYKHWVHEGGISTPFVVSWPGMIPEKGGVVNTPANIIDLMPTFVELSGTSYPLTFNGHTIAPLPGKSLVRVFKGGTLPDRPIFWEHEANRAVRIKDWKLVSKGSNVKPYTGQWELYDMDKDRAETKDLAAKYPDKVKTMASMWQKWAESNRVFPLNGGTIPQRKEFKVAGE